MNRPGTGARLARTRMVERQNDPSSVSEAEGRTPAVVEHGPDCGCTRCQGFSPGNLAAKTHGATSERQTRPVARAQRRRFLRQNGLRASDVDAVGLALLDSWSRAQAKVELLDSWFAEHGFLDAAGEPRAAAKTYFTALNAARSAMVRLADHLRGRALGPDPLDALEGVGRRIRLEREGEAE